MEVGKEVAMAYYKLLLEQLLVMVGSLKPILASFTTTTEVCWPQFGIKIELFSQTLFPVVVCRSTPFGGLSCLTFDLTVVSFYCTSLNW